MDRLTLHNHSPLELEEPWGFSSSGLCFNNKEIEVTRKPKAAKLPISTVYLAQLIGCLALRREGTLISIYR